VTTPPPTDPGEQTSSWKDAARPVSERVDLLLAEMTLEEKLAQLGSRWLRSDMPSRWLESDMPSR
jgi:beta-glucosidase